ncbi:MAG: Sua5 YciO YrdC YwlC family protein [Campylobacterales bacterium]|nr:Sua5 YciO YrdC YwlC family protein [Campylobacterales bacterium]NQY53214.1 Sua5 YciO YrdC YwlC family protein [Campylobacteraceae bacterium]
MDSSLVYLVQTDTTVGFSSSNDEKLSIAKRRNTNQKILQTVDSFKTLKSSTRIPNKYKNMVRKANLSTFIYPKGESFRVISQDSTFYDFIKKFSILYSTSANLTKKVYDEKFAFENAEVLVTNNFGFNEMKASKIYKINNFKIKRLR